MVQQLSNITTQDTERDEESRHSNAAVEAGWIGSILVPVSRPTDLAGESSPDGHE
jgi:hypothetical protein